MCECIESNNDFWKQRIQKKDVSLFFVHIHVFSYLMRHATTLCQSAITARFILTLTRLITYIRHVSLTLDTFATA